MWWGLGFVFRSALCRPHISYRGLCWHEPCPVVVVPYPALLLCEVTFVVWKLDREARTPASLHLSIPLQSPCACVADEVADFLRVWMAATNPPDAGLIIPLAPKVFESVGDGVAVTKGQFNTVESFVDVHARSRVGVEVMCGCGGV